MSLATVAAIVADWWLWGLPVFFGLIAGGGSLALGAPDWLAVILGLVVAGGAFQLLADLPLRIIDWADSRLADEDPE